MKQVFVNGETVLIGPFKELKAIYKSCRRNGFWVPFECPKCRYEEDIHIMYINEGSLIVDWCGRDASAQIIYELIKDV